MSPTPNRAALFIGALALAALGCVTLMGVRPPVTWDSDPAAVVLSVTTCCANEPAWMTENYIPEVQLWGDGRLLWVEHNSAGGRRLLTGTLTPDQVRALLRRYVDAGFFDWDALYGDYVDGSAQCINLALSSATKQVCEYYTGAPEAFHQLYAAAASGAGTLSAPYVPTRGYVTAYRQQFVIPPLGDNYLVWPADALDLPLDQLSTGAWLDGEAFALAWRVVSGDTWQPLTRQGETYYFLTVRLPGLSELEPPAPN
jgi:hypothetical protein